VLVFPVLALAAGGGDAHEGVNVQSLLFSFINFGLLLALFVYMGRGPITSFLKSRKEEIESQLAEATRLKAEAEQKHAEYSSRLAALDGEMESMKKSLIESGQADRDRIIKDAELKADRMRTEATFLIEQHAKQLRGELKRVAAEVAVETARDLLGRTTKAIDQERLAKDYLDKLQQIAQQGSTRTEGTA